MRKSTALVASFSLSLLALTGCTATTTSSALAACERETASSDIGELATITGDVVGEAPEVDAFSPVRSTSVEFTDVIVGSGNALENGRQPAVMDFAFYDGETGEQVFSTEFNGDLTRVGNISLLAEAIPAFADVLTCATEGSRVLALIPNSTISPQTLPIIGVAAEGTTIAVIDLLDVMEPGARGTQQFNDRAGMPTVVRTDNGQPGVLIPDADAPTSVVEQTIIQGTGETITDSSGTVWVDVLGVEWDTRTAPQNTWDETPVALERLAAAPDVVAAVMGKPVGSEILVVVPGAEGESAMAYVVDILGTSPALPPVQ